MKLPNAETAVVEIDKLRDYCLSFSHVRGRHKARVFQSALGLTATHADELRAALLAAVRAEEATLTEADDYGQRYVVDFTMSRADRTARIRSSWIIRVGENVPRLTSCFVM